MMLKRKRFDRVVLLLAVAFQALLFYSFYSREIAWYPPLNFDQAVFLTETYRLEEKVLAGGPGKLWSAIWSPGHFSELTLPFEGVLAGLVLGGTRLPQLCLNFIAFATLQTVAFTLARSVWGRFSGYAVLGLILCQMTPWFWAGGLFDFRMDFSAYCLYGIWVCSVVRSHLFLDRRWAIGSGLIGALLVLTRFVTIVYLLGVCVGFAAVCVGVGLIWRADTDLRCRMWRRVRHLGLSLGILVLIAAPILIRNWGAINDYYILKHAVGEEKNIRAAEFGIHDLAGHLLFYPRSIVYDHLGPAFLWTSAIAIAVCFATRVLVRSPIESARGRDEIFPLQIVFLLGTILGPIAVLTMDIAKSPLVGGIVGVPVALLIVAGMARLAPWRSNFKAAFVQNIIFACAMAIFVFGLFHQFSQAAQHSREFAQREDLKRLTELETWLADYAEKHDWHSPTISLDVISGWLNAGAITANGYERLHEFIEFHQMLGGSIMGVEKAEALSLLANSDFLILTKLPENGVYPFYQHVAQYWNDLRAWSDKNMVVVRTVPFDGFTATVYVRPSATVSGLSGGWITSAGLSIKTDRAGLQRFPRIRLSGPANYSWLPKVPTVTATMETDGRTQAVPASLKRNDNSYDLLIDCSNMELPPSDPIRLHLNFDTFFVPNKIGINDDPRELVVYSPTLVQLIPR
jgi:hypothetical protein